MKKRNKNKFLVFFYPEANGAYSVFSPDFKQSTCGRNKSEARRMAADLLNILFDLEEYKNLRDAKNRKTHLEVDPCELYYEFTGDRLEHDDSKGVFYRYVSPKLYVCK